MKRLLMMLLVLMMLAGCTTQPPAATDPTVPPTEPQAATPWVETLGMDWDAEGILKEMPLSIPDGLHYTAATEFDGDLLLWSVDDHRSDRIVFEMVVIELDDGSVLAQKDLEVVGYIYPQCLDDRLYLCDGTGGVITALDKNLEITDRWEMEPTEDPLVVGAGGVLYRNQDSHLLRIDLNTGDAAPLLAEDPRIDWFSENGHILTIRYFLPENGMPAYCALDLRTGETVFSQADSRIDSVARMGTVWLHEIYGESYTYYLYGDDGTEWRCVPENASLRLLEEGYLLGSTMDSSVLSLYTLEGDLVSSARLSERETGYFGNSLIWNETHGGYFFVFRSFDETTRLLFWDISGSLEGADLAVEPIPQPEEAQLRLEARAKELGEKYGLIIYVGEQCDTRFDDFYASLATDYDQVSSALNVLERAMSAYPEGMIRQLRYDYVQSIQVHLIADLQADGNGRTGGGYNAFTQTMWDHSLMVIDIEDSSEQTYYHEMSHLIDKYLEWHAQEHSDALFSEASWVGLNPMWFDGYTYDYSWEQDLWNGEAFIDGYATISPTEDRARVLEYAMADTGNYHFAKGTVLYRKLDYYARCIRDAFDTTGWTGKPLWEQFL